MKFSIFAPLLLIFASATGQDAPPKPVEPVFPLLYPRPTGTNGYEEIVRAGDLARAHDGLNRAFSEQISLTEKRRILRESTAIQARDLLRAGLEKPIKSPLSESNSEAGFQSFAGIRQLARLLVLEQYVLFADGKIGEAIDSARDGLRLAYAVSSQMIIGGLVGNAVDAMMIRSLADRLDQMSARDCEKLVKLAVDWIAMPDPALTALEFEREYALKQVHATLGGDSRITPQIHALVSARIRSVQSLLRQEPWKRTSLPPLEASGPAAEYVRNLKLDEFYLQALERFTVDLARVQMLGVHGAVRRFRWEHNRLPASLDEMSLGRLAIDPFTGRAFAYQKSDSVYSLKSAKVERL